MSIDDELTDLLANADTLTNAQKTIVLDILNARWNANVQEKIDAFNLVKDGFMEALQDICDTNAFAFADSPKNEILQITIPEIENWTPTQRYYDFTI